MKSTKQVLTIKSRNHVNTMECKELNEWCKAVIGRQTLLRDLVFPTSKTKLSCYKSGRVKINPYFWGLIKACMSIIESNEQNGQLNFDMTFREKVNSWIESNKKQKLRLANVIWAYNYTAFKDRSLANLRTNLFTLNVSNMNKDLCYNESRMIDVMNKVDAMIKEDSAIAMAS